MEAKASSGALQELGPNLYLGCVYVKWVSGGVGGWVEGGNRENMKAIGAITCINLT